MADAQIIDSIPVEEADAWYSAMHTTFLETADGPEFEAGHAARVSFWAPGRHWGARADGRWVATLATLQRRLTVPGFDYPLATVPADALTGVTVSATHRRQGLLTAMLSRSLEAAKRRGDAVSVLIAAETSIYGRFGYAPAERTATSVLHRRPGGAPPPAADGGRLRQVDTEEFGRLAPPVFQAAIGLRAGNIDRPPGWWDRTLGLNGVTMSGPRPTYIVRTGPQGPDGFVVWRATQESGLDGSYGAIDVVDLVASNDAAYQALWHYLATMDLVGRVRLKLRPVDEPVRWLLRDFRALEQTYTGDGLWLRLLDVPAALSARRYSASDRLVLEVRDDDIGGYGQGRFVLDGGPSHASCRRVDQGDDSEVDLSLSQRALSSIYLGGHSLREQLIAGLVQEHTFGAVRRADAMFATAVAPWLHTSF
jgi:predicted acetyltransferase